MKLAETIQRSLLKYLSPEKATAKTNHFLAQLAQEISRVQRLNLNSDENTYFVSLDILRKKAGKFVHNKKQYWLSQEILRLGNGSGCDLLESGNNIQKKLSLIKVNCSLAEIMQYFEYQDLINEHQAAINAADPESIWTTRIQYQELLEYTTELESKIQTESVAWKQAKLNHELHAARQILACAETDKNGYFLRQPTQRSAFGARLYLTGVNLQNSPKNVRKKALASAHQYDVKAASFCLLYSIYRELSVMYSVDQFQDTKAEDWICYESYMANREAWRLSVYEDLFGQHPNPASTRGYYAVKEAFTALGFGARASGKIAFQHNGSVRYGALNTIFGDKQLAEKFVANPFVSAIIRCLMVIMDLVALHFSTNSEIIPGYPCPEKNGKVSRSRLVAHVYQSFEALLLNQCIAAAGEENIALPVHDCLITYSRDRDFKIAQVYSNFSRHLKLEHEIFPSTLRVKATQEVESHIKHIKESEILSQEYQRIKSMSA